MSRQQHVCLSAYAHTFPPTVGKYELLTYGVQFDVPKMELFLIYSDYLDKIKKHIKKK